MQKIFFKLTCSAFLGALFVLAPDVAFAADGNVFSIIANKMVSTVKDVRSVVYVLAGFGLIVFAVMAIFNKISFKHLGYICIGLFLLSVMMPFINYFSGAQLKDELVYGNFTENMGDTFENAAPPMQSCETDPALCPKEEDSSQSLDDKLAGLTPPELSMPQNTAFDDNGCRIKDGKQECCKNGKKGVNKKGTKCKITFKDALNGVKDAVALGVGALKTAQKAKDTIEGAVENTKHVIEAAKNIGDSENFLDAMGNVAALGKAVDRTASGVVAGAQLTADRSKNVLDKYVDMNDDFTATKDSDRMARLEQAQEKVDKGVDNFKDKTDKVRDASNDYIRDPAKTLDSAAVSGGVMKNQAEDLGDWFGGGGSK